ncbi:MAG: hypothetical protein U5K72_17185 [Balneolaceae bacterium]|nr:hypothetical protein [Balneolaceae bacterium]
MQVIYLESFKKDLQKIKNQPTKEKIKKTVLKIKKAPSLDKITNIKSIKESKMHTVYGQGITESDFF